jgi:hypothetical protein
MHGGIVNSFTKSVLNNTLQNISFTLVPLHSTTVMSCLQESVSEVSEESLEHREPTGVELVPPLVLLEREEAHELVDVFFSNEEIENLFFRFVQF